MEKSPFLIQLISFVHLTVQCLTVLIVPRAPAIYFTPHQILAKVSKDFLMKFQHFLK